MTNVVPHTLTTAFLEKLSEILDELSSTGRPPADPGIVLLSGLTLNVAASFASGLLTPAMALVYGAILSTASGKLKAWLKTTSLLTAFTAVVAAPAAVQDGSRGALLFLARASGAAGALIGTAASLGWYQLLLALHRLKLLNPLTWELWVTLRIIPVFARDAARMLAAREARLLARDRKSALRAVGSTLGDLVLEGYWRAKALSLALAARTFAESPAPPGCRARLDWRAIGLAAYTASAIAFLLSGA